MLRQTLFDTLRCFIMLRCCLPGKTV